MGVTQKSNQRVKEVTQGEGLAWMSSPQAREFWGGGKGGAGKGGRQVSSPAQTKGTCCAI